MQRNQKNHRGKGEDSIPGSGKSRCKGPGVAEYSTFQKLPNVQTAQVHGVGQHVEQAEAAERVLARGEDPGATPRTVIAEYWPGKWPDLSVFRKQLWLQSCKPQRGRRESIWETTAIVLASE